MMTLQSTLTLKDIYTNILITLLSTLPNGNFTLALKGTRDNFKIHVNFMKHTFLCSLRQDEAYDKK